MVGVMAVMTIMTIMTIMTAITAIIMIHIRSSMTIVCQLGIAWSSPMLIFYLMPIVCHTLTSS
jgi:hypothetical protein